MYSVELMKTTTSPIWASKAKNYHPKYTRSYIYKLNLVGQGYKKNL